MDKVRVVLLMFLVIGSVQASVSLIGQLEAAQAKQASQLKSVDK